MHSSNEAQNKQVLVGARAWRQTSSTLQFSVILDFHKGNAAGGRDDGYLASAKDEGAFKRAVR